MKQPQFTDRTIATPLWYDNARALRVLREARHNKLHRRAFPWLAIVAGLCLARFIVWACSI